MLARLVTSMMQDMNLMEVHMLSRKSLEPLGSGIVCVSVVVLMEASVISTVIQVLYQFQVPMFIYLVE